MANKSLVNLWKHFYYYYFLSLFSYKKTAKVTRKVFYEFMYYISNNSPKPSQVISLPSPPPPPLHDPSTSSTPNVENVEEV